MPLQAHSLEKGRVTIARRSEVIKEIEHLRTERRVLIKQFRASKKSCLFEKQVNASKLDIANQSHPKVESTPFLQLLVLFLEPLTAAKKTILCLVQLYILGLYRSYTAYLLVLQDDGIHFPDTISSKPLGCVIF